jgi:hypothetical protein
MEDGMDIYRRVSSFYFLFILFLIIPASAFGVTVTNTDDSGPGSLRQAVLDTPPGGTGIGGCVVRCQEKKDADCLKVAV